MKNSKKNPKICSPNDNELSDVTENEFITNWGTLEQEDICSYDYYFNSYSHISIHEEMLKDNVRTNAYRSAILSNSHLFKDKIVLDVGSGTGILSLFAASAGAQHVYGIECSDIVEMAKKIIDMNGYGDKITFIKGKAEEVELPVDKVDIIISEWMGYLLLYESMLDTIIFIRDKWLAPNGMIFPDKASIHIAAIEDEYYKHEKISFWNNVYGFDFSCLKKCVMEEPIVDVVNPNVVVTTSSCLLNLDLNTCLAKDIYFCVPYSIRVNKKNFVHALIIWFDIVFSQCHKPIVLTTSPSSASTHWKQSIFYIEHVLVCHDNECITGIVAMKKSPKNYRDLDIKISYNHNGKYFNVSNTQCYRMR